MLEPSGGRLDAEAGEPGAQGDKVGVEHWWSWDPESLGKSVDFRDDRWRANFRDDGYRVAARGAPRP